MRRERLLDNDVLIKLATYDLLEPLIESFEHDVLAYVLSSAQFVAPEALSTKQLNDADAALEALRLGLARLEELEPSEAEVALATSIEDRRHRGAR